MNGMLTQLALNAIAKCLAPKRKQSVSEWADAYRVLSLVGSAEPGQWKTSRTPYLREIMDQLSEDSPARLVAFMKASQVGGTEVASNWLGYIMTHAKGPVAVVMPTEKSLNDWMSQKFDPMASDTLSVASVLAKRSNAAGNNSAERKRFAGGILYAKTAGSTAELKSTSLRYAIADEVDEYDWSTLQGDPLGLLQVRLTTYHDRKLFIPSSPTLKDASRIEDLFEGGDKRYYHVPCPHCREMQALSWANVRWSRPPNNPRRVLDAWYVCRECGAEIQEYHKTNMLAAGRWIAAASGAAYPSYHLSGLYSPIGLGLSWRELAEEWIEAQDDHSKLMRFVNTRLGETWADRTGDIKANVLEARAEPYLLRTIPPGCLVLTAGCDIQDDRIEIQIVGWGQHDRCWIIDYHVLPGNPADEAVWQQLAQYLTAEFAAESGVKLKIEAVGIDSGGHHTHAAYQFARSAAVRRALALKGVPGTGRAILGKPSQQDVNYRGRVAKRGVLLYSVGVDTAKHLLYARLHADVNKDPSERKVRFSSMLESHYYDQLTAEAFNPRKQRWELKKGKRNEALDTFVYALAASHHPELYLHKWRVSDWERRAKMIDAPAEPATEAEPRGKDASAMNHLRVPPAPKRGGFSTSWGPK